jgi:hypothetical protein
MTTILTKKKDTTGAPAPGDLTNAAGGAELAVNTFDKRLYTKDAGGNVVEIGTNPSIIDTTTVDTTNLEVTNIKAKDGTAAATIANSTGKITVSTELAVDNLNLSGNTISSTDTNGAINLAPNGAGQVVFNAGAVGTPIITTTGDTNTGIFFPAADTIAFSEGGTESARFDSSGNLLVGTTSSTFADGSGASISRSGATAALQVNRSDAGTAGSISLISGSSANGLFGAGAKPLILFTDSTERMRIDSAGNVGIGTSSPATKLNVEGTLRINRSGVAVQYLNLYATSGVGFIDSIDSGSGTNQPIAFRNGNNSTTVERMRITSDGKVGIATDTPIYNFQVGGNLPCVGISLISTTDTALIFKGSAAGTDFEHAKIYSGRDTTAFSFASYLAFYTEGKNSGTTDTSTEKMRITAYGDLCIGTTTPQITSGATRGNITLNGSSSAIINLSVGDVNKAQIYHGGTDMFIGNQANGYLMFQTSATERMRIDSSGNVGINNSSPTYRLDSMGSLALGTSARSGITVATTTGMYVYQTNNGGSFEMAFAVGGSSGPGGVNALSKISFFSNALDITTNNAIPITIGTNGNERMRISTNGQVGIGTNNPAVPLDVVSDGSAEVLRLRGRSSDNIGTVRFTSNDGSTTYGAIQGRSTYIEYATSQAIPLIFSTNSAERMRIHSSGGVSIGNTTDAGAGNLSVTGAVSATTAFRETNGLSNIANGATFTISIPTSRRPQLLTVYSTYNLYQTTIALVCGDNSSNVGVTLIVNGGGVTLAGTAPSTVTVTNGLGGTANIYWSLLPLGVGV